MTRAEFAGAPLIATMVAAAPPGTQSVATPFVFARAEFMRRANRPSRHRQTVAARSLNGGIALHLMRNSLNAYDTPGGFGEGPGSLHVAGVLYGTSIAVLLDNSVWATLRLAEFLQRLGELPPGKITANPYADVVAELIRSDVSFFVCNNALHDLADALAAAPTTREADAGVLYATLRRGLDAHCIIVPAGVAAINALAEYKFSLIQATI